MQSQPQSQKIHSLSQLLGPRPFNLWAPLEGIDSRVDTPPAIDVAAPADVSRSGFLERTVSRPAFKADVHPSGQPSQSNCVSPEWGAVSTIAIASRQSSETASTSMPRRPTSTTSQMEGSTSGPDCPTGPTLNSWPAIARPQGSSSPPAPNGSRPNQQAHSSGSTTPGPTPPLSRKVRASSASPSNATTP